MTKEFSISVLAVCFTLFGFTTAFAEDLGKELRKNGWERIIGTWVDSKTKGNLHHLEFHWKYQDKVIEIINREGETETTALMGRNPKLGQVFYVAADNRGGSSIGEWTFQGEEAVLGLLLVTGTGEESGLEIRHKLVDDRTMSVTVVLPQPVTFKLERSDKE